MVQAADGRTLHVDGRTFARVLGNTGVFRGAADTGPVVLVTSAPLKTSQGSGFRDVLLREFGVQEPVYVPKGEARLLFAQDGRTLHDPTAGTPGRAVRPVDAPRGGRSDGDFAQSSDRGDVDLMAPGSRGTTRAPWTSRMPEGVGPDGQVRRFRPEDVRYRVMTRWGSRVGLTFLTGGERSASLAWGGAPRGEHLNTFVHPEGDGPSGFPGSDGAQPVRGRWREDSMYVAVEGAAGGFELRLTDG
ncbi:hypothetical protein, partial [Lentzea aerocolonigenes]|uniref:hypothetical protein n=1 Tax=Lentzea aerocolonigenes TaxID=68170 RepID=UPI0018C888FC